MSWLSDLFKITVNVSGGGTEADTLSLLRAMEIKSKVHSADSNTEIKVDTTKYWLLTSLVVANDGAASSPVLQYFPNGNSADTEYLVGELTAAGGANRYTSAMDGLPNPLLCLPNSLLVITDYAWLAGRTFTIRYSYIPLDINDLVAGIKSASSSRKYSGKISGKW